MAKPGKCPPEKTLKELIQGKINEPQLSELSAHLESCGGCQEKAKTLGPFDTFSDPLRGDPGLAKKIAAGIPRPLIEKVKSIARAKDNTVGFAQKGSPTHAGTEEVNIDFLAPPQQPDEIGRLGSYRILKVLGKGGMGMVFLGHDPHLDRSVALKVMLPKFAANEAAKQRFLREARTAAKLHHDHIVSIYQVGEDRGVPYLAMEFLEGAPLDQYLQGDRKLSLPQILRITREIAKGLSAAHEKGLIHRDIKPGNIWLDKANAGRAKILDFGLARSDKEDIHLTQSGAIVGTPAYMSPEQARGDKVDGRADLFSLGCVLYRLCVGDIPFKGDTTMNVLMALAMTDPTPPNKINAQIPDSLSDLTMQLLDKDPNNRPASAKEVIAKIQQIERDLKGTKSEVSKTQAVEPVLMAHPVSMASARPVKRRRSPVLVAIAAGLAAFAVIAAGIIFYWQTNNGIVKIEIKDPNIKVTFDKDGAIIAGASDKHEIKLRAGEHGFTVEGGGLKFDTDKFILKRGETTTLKIEMMKGPLLLVTRDGKQIGQVEGPVAVAPPPVDYALHFDGNNHVELPDLAIDATKPFTLETYAVPDKVDFEDGRAWLVSKPSVCNLALRKGFWAFNRLTTGTGVNAPAAAIVGKRVHVAGVYDGVENRLYVDGKLVSSKQKDAKIVPVPKKKYTLGDLGFVGLLDEMRISKVARYDKDFTPAKRFETDQDTLALYHFDEGSGDVLKDSSGNGHHGKIVGAKWVKADEMPLVGSADYALSFDGNSKVRIDSLVFDPTKPFTVEATATLTSFSQQFPSVVGVGPSVWGLNATRTGERWQFQFQGKKTGSITASHPVVKNRRTDLAGVFDGKQVRIFADGKLIGTTPMGDDVPMASKTLWLELGSLFNGTIKEVRISKTVRYTTDYRPAQRFAPDKDTVALYHFDEGSGDVLKDSSGNNHHGKIIGAKWVNADGTPIAPAATGHYALQFSSKDHAVELPKALAVDASSDFTLEGFVNLAGSYAHLVGTSSIAVQTSTQPWRFQVYAAEGKPFFVRDTTGPASQYAKRRVHVAGVRAGGNLRLFVEGRLVGAEVLDGKFFTRPNEIWRIGMAEAVIDEVRISKIARYDKDFTPAKRFEPDKDTVALYHFDEGSGDELKDSSGNGHHGKIVGAKWVKVDGTPISSFPPLDPAWLKAVAAMPATEQVAAVKAELMKRNLGFDGRILSFKTGDASEVTELAFLTDHVSDLSPVRALAELHSLRCYGTSGGSGKIVDLSPLQGMKLTRLFISYNQISELSPLKSLPLTELLCHHCPKLTDLSPLANLKLTSLDFGFTRVGSLAPLKGMKLTHLSCIGTQVSDLLPLQGMPLTTLKFWSSGVKDLTPLKGMLLKEVSCNFKAERDAEILRSIETLEKINGKTKAEFWKEVDGAPAFDAWLKKVAAMKAEQQVEAVKAELMKRNPGFEGKNLNHKTEGGVVSLIALATDKVTDISPLRAFKELRTLDCSGTKGAGQLADLTPLTELALTQLDCSGTCVADLTPLKNMKLTKLWCEKTQVADLSPLVGMPLTTLGCDFKAERDATILRSIPTLQTINGKAAAAFWKEVDQKKP